jgi:predicted kinase
MKLDLLRRAVRRHTVLFMVAGPPCSGKSCLTDALEGDLRVPALRKDDFKEVLFDTLGWSDPWSTQLVGQAAMELLFTQSKKLLDAEVSHIIEANFRSPDADDRLQALTERSDRSMLIYCTAPDDVLARRLEERVSGEARRHPGHREAEDFVAIMRKLKVTEWEPRIPASLILYDSTRPKADAHARLLRSVSELLLEGERGQ